MVFLRILAFFYMVYWVLSIARNLLGSAPRGGPGVGGGPRRPPNFDAYGPFGPFGPQAPPRGHYQSQRQSAYEAPPRQPPPPPRPPPKSAHSILGLRPGASADEVRRAWRSRAALHHPDAGGDPATFHALTNARDQLLVGNRRGPAPVSHRASRVERALRPLRRRIARRRHPRVT